VSNKPQNFFRNIKVISIIALIVLSGIILLVATGVLSSEYLSFIVVGFIAVLLFLIIYLLLRGPKFRTKYIDNLISSKPKKRFKYLDTFYYIISTSYYDANDRAYEYRVFHVIQDIESQKVYAIGESSTNVRFQNWLDNTKVLRIDNMTGISTHKDWKEVRYGDEGSFWVDEEMTGCYQNDGKNITINYFGQKDSIKEKNGISNRNEDYDISLFEKATFITGHVIFDAKE